MDEPLILGTRFVGVYQTLPIAVEVGEGGWRWKLFGPGGEGIIDGHDPVWVFNDSKEGAMLEAVTAAVRVARTGGDAEAIIKTIEWQQVS